MHGGLTLPPKFASSAAATECRHAHTRARAHKPPHCKGEREIARRLTRMILLLVAAAGASIQPPAVLLERRRQPPPPVAIRFVAHQKTAALEALADGDGFAPWSSTNIEDGAAGGHAQRRS